MILLIIFTSVVLFLVHEFYWKRRGLPPGPVPLPVFGNVMQMLSYPPPGIEAFAAWRKRYGDVYTFWLGNEPLVVVNGYKTIKESFVNDGESYVDKLIINNFNSSMRGGDFGVIDTNGSTWKEHRRFALHTLRDFGLGKEAMEASILLEIDKMEEDFKLSGGGEISLQAAFDLAIGNVINQFLFGNRFENRKKFYRLKYLLDLFFESQATLRVYLVYFSKLVPASLVDLFTPDVCEVRDGVFQFFKEQIDEHRQEIDFESEESKDYVETFLKEQKRRAALGDTEIFSNDNLRNMCFDMWVAGAHTTTSTMGFVTGFALNNLDAMRKMQKELKEVIGDRVVTMKDKINLPYTSAFVNESQRLGNIVPINLIHSTTREVTINGHHLPAGTAVLHQISGVMSDPEVFPEPDVFKPERFLNTDGTLKKVDELVPFSIGRRMCLGEGLAKMELFLLTANLFNRYDISAGSQGTPTLAQSYTAVLRVQDFTCKVTPRYRC